MPWAPAEEGAGTDLAAAIAATKFATTAPAAARRCRERCPGAMQVKLRRLGGPAAVLPAAGCCTRARLHTAGGRLQQRCSRRAHTSSAAAIPNANTYPAAGHACDLCCMVFPSRNKLFKHLAESCAQAQQQRQRGAVVRRHS